MSSIGRKSEIEDLIAEQPELVDVHVKTFSGDPDRTAAAIEELFAIDGSAARRLVAGAPLVVKRAVSRELAREFVDALQSVGARVVVLPTRPGPARAAELPRPSLRPETSGEAGWGGLDLAGQGGSDGRYILSCADVDDDVIGPSSSFPPDTDDAEPDEPFGEDDIDDTLDDAFDELDLGASPANANAAGGEESDVLEIAVASAAPAASSLAGAALGGPPPSPPASMVDLGLGSVPPLPSLPAVPQAAAPPPPPPRAIGPDGAGLAALPSLPPLDAPAGGRKGFANRTLEAPVGAASAAIELAVPDAERTKVPRNPRRTPGGAPSPTAREEAERFAQLARDRQRAAEAAAQEARRSARRRRMASVAGVVLGVVVFAAGWQMDSSILFGNASPLSVVCHALGIFAMGAGVKGLKS